MSAASEVRSDKIQVSKGGQPIIHNSGLLDLVTAVTEQNAILVPFDATIVSVKSRVRTACGTAAGLAAVEGVEKGSAYASQSHDTTDAAGTEFEWTLTDAVVPAGEVLYFTGDGGATTTGDVDVTVTLAGRQ